MIGRSSGGGVLQPTLGSPNIYVSSAIEHCLQLCVGWGGGAIGGDFKLSTRGRGPLRCLLSFVVHTVGKNTVHARCRFHYLVQDTPGYGDSNDLAADRRAILVRQWAGLCRAQLIQSSRGCPPVSILVWWMGNPSPRWGLQS